MTKRAPELPVLAALALDAGGAGDEAERVQRLVRRQAQESRLDEASRAIVLRKHHRRAEALGAPSAADAELVAAFERTLAEDSVRNEYQLGRTLHAWFASGPTPEDVDALNERVYAELFLTPSSDPWLGLLPADAYAALEPEA
jgi:hypothetical protein